jgi:hypothetical protein
MSTLTFRKATLGLLLLSPMMGNAAVLETKTYDLGKWLPNDSYSAIQRSSDSVPWINEAGSLLAMTDATTSRARIGSDTSFTNRWIFELTASSNLGSIVVNDYAVSPHAKISSFAGYLSAIDPTTNAELGSPFAFGGHTGPTGQDLGINFDPSAGAYFPNYGSPLAAGHYAIVLSGVTGAKSLDYGSYGSNSSVTPVPEPEEWAMMMLGLPLLGFISRRKKSDKDFNLTNALAA